MITAKRGRGERKGRKIRGERKSSKGGEERKTGRQEGGKRRVERKGRQEDRKTGREEGRAHRTRASLHLSKPSSESLRMESRDSTSVLTASASPHPVSLGTVLRWRSPTVDMLLPMTRFAQWLIALNAARQSE
jgi:hypothetical protein